MPADPVGFCLFTFLWVMSPGGQQLHPQRPRLVDSMPSRMGLSGGLGRCASSGLFGLTFGLEERPQWPCGPGLQSSPQAPGTPTCRQKPDGPSVCSTASSAVSLASASCRPRPGLLPTAEAALPAGAGGQCHSSLSILPGSVRAMRQPGLVNRTFGYSLLRWGALGLLISSFEYGLWL